MTRRLSHDDMRCPSCGSRYTQYLPTCFSLTRQSGRYEPVENEFHRLIERPEKRSTILVPTVAASNIYALAAMAISLVRAELDISQDWKRDLFSPEVIWPALALGLISWVALIARAWRFNRGDFRTLFDEWSGSAICRRCSTKFRAPDRVVAKYRRQS